MREAQSIAIVHNMPQEHEQYIVARKVDGVVVEELSFKITITPPEEYGRRFGWNNQS